MASDNFNRADGLISAGVPAWTQFAGSGGTLSVASNVVVGSNSSDKFYYYSGAATSADQYAQFLLAGINNGDYGPACRVGSNGFSGYLFTPNGNYWAKIVTSSFTILPVVGGTSAINDVLRIEVEGSTLRAFRNGVATSTPSTTDTSLTTAGNGVGVFHYEQTHAFDDWAGGDLTAPPSVTYTLASHNTSPLTWR